ncbi:KilA-N domain-containing protein [Paludibacteraceae bacterium OttesenSCG-928-F17]|nr:KilA-N domain-containing protein [Paludibacteraceae bacterium OttesenSCG-928-F17]
MKNQEDYICLTDMVSNIEDGSKLIEKWLTNKSTIEFLGIWEQLNNQNFNSPEFGGIMNEAGTNRFYMSVKQWINRTSAVGIVAKAGRYGGTYAHKDIAFNFGLYISPAFQLYLVREYQRLKEIENNQYSLEWNVKRVLTKVNNQIHTDAVKNYIIPQYNYSKDNEWIAYAEEADLLNIALFGCTAKQWREANPQRVLRGENIRDMASINELTILSTLESLNAMLIRNNIDKINRFQILRDAANDQKEKLDKIDFVKSVKKESESTYIEIKEQSNTIKQLDKELGTVMRYSPKKKKEQFNIPFFFSQSIKLIKL